MTGQASGWQWCAAFAAGALCLPLLPVLPPVWWMLIAVVAAALGAYRYAALLLPALAVAGFTWSGLHAHHAMADTWPQSRDGQRIEVSGRIAGLTRVGPSTFRFVLIPERGDDADLPRRVHVTWHRPAGFPQAGEVWRMRLNMQAPRGQANPGAFDRERWLLSERIGATATVAGPARRVAQGARGAFTRQRQALAEWLQAESVDRDAAALHRALALADRGGVRRELGDDLRRTGTAHLLAISGLHVGMVAAVGALIGGLLATPLSLLAPGLDRRRCALIVGLTCALGYAFLAGFTLPTQRALLMLTVGAGALLLRRGLQPGHALVLALAAVLLLDPLAPLAAGFWLSFAAVGVLIWGLAWRSTGGGWLSGLLRAQLLIAVGMLPLNAGVFQQLVPGALAANLVAIPLVAFWILPALLAAVALELAGTGWAVIPLAFSEYGLTMLVRLLSIIAAWPMTAVPVPGASGVTLALAFAGALWLIAPRGMPGRWLGLVLMLPLLLPHEQRPTATDIWVMDAGRGFAVLVFGSEQTWMIDTGSGDGAGRDQSAQLLTPLMLRYARQHLDGVIVTRPVAAHAGGLAGVLAAYPPRLEPVGTGTRPCHAGDTWQAGGVEIEVLHPSPALPDLGQDSACVLRIAAGGHTLLLASSVGRTIGERLALFELGQAPDIIIAAGNGRDLFDSPALAALAPHASRITARDTGTGYSTAQCGAIRIRLEDGGPPILDGWRRMQRRFWRAGAGPRCP